MVEGLLLINAKGWKQGGNRVETGWKQGGKKVQDTLICHWVVHGSETEEGKTRGRRQR